MKTESHTRINLLPHKYKKVITGSYTIHTPAGRPTSRMRGGRGSSLPFVHRQRGYTVSTKTKLYKEAANTSVGATLIWKTPSKKNTLIHDDYFQSIQNRIFITYYQQKV